MSELEGNRKQLLKVLTTVSEKNEEFIFKHSHETFIQIIEFVNDAIDHLSSLPLGPRRTASAFAFFLQHSLLPQSYALYADVLTGNLPVCFFELRTMLETLAKAYYADVNHPAADTFWEKFELVDTQRISTTEMIRHLEKDLDRVGSIVPFWEQLSNEWVHTKGQAVRLMKQVVEQDSMPAWGLALPMTYDHGDVSALKDLADAIKKLRDIVAAAKMWDGTKSP